MFIVALCFFLISVIGARIGALLSLDEVLFCLACSFRLLDSGLLLLSRLWFNSELFTYWLFLNLRYPLPLPACRIWCRPGPLKLWSFSFNNVWSSAAPTLLWVILSNWDLVIFWLLPVGKWSNYWRTPLLFLTTVPVGLWTDALWEASYYWGYRRAIALDELPRICCMSINEFYWLVRAVYFWTTLVLILLDELSPVPNELLALLSSPAGAICPSALVVLRPPFSLKNDCDWRNWLSSMNDTTGLLPGSGCYCWNFLSFLLFLLLIALC